MASVTFPTALGGDGKTYSDDADPNTGLDGLGYVERFVPCLQNAVAMAGYTAQYAAKIDAAAANADRAEDARKFVEAMGDAYKVNLKDAYQDKITLGADFKAGRYTKDDTVRVDTGNASDIFNSARSTPVFGQSLSGRWRETQPDKIQREWDNGSPLGLKISRGVSYVSQNSDVLSAPGWSNVTASYRELTAELSPVANKNWWQIDGVVENSGVSHTGDFTLRLFVERVSGDSIDLTVLGVSFNNRAQAQFNFNSKTFTSTAALGVFSSDVSVKAKEIRPGIFVLSVSGNSGSVSVERFRIGRSGGVFNVIGAQIVNQRNNDSYYPTTGSSVTTLPDNIILENSLALTAAASIYIEFDCPAPANGNYAAIELGDGTQNNRLQIGRNANGRGVVIAVTNSEAVLLTTGGLNWPNTGPAKALISFERGRLIFAWCGELLHDTTDFEVPDISQLRLGRGAAAENYTGLISEFFLSSVFIDSNSAVELTAL